MSDKNKVEEKSLTEPLFIRSAGYLKPPEKFKRKYPELLDPIESEDPEARVSETDKEIRLIYVWRK